MKKQITEEQIKQISTGEKDIRDVFPEVFEPKLEAWKWYELKGNDECICLFTGDNGIGFDYDGEWGENISMSIPNLWILARQEKVEKALIKEAKNRKLWDNKNVKCLISGKKNNTSSLGKVFIDNKLWSSSALVFNKGKWAEIISKPIKKYKVNNITCKTYEQAEALIALAQLSQLIPDYNGDWVADFNKESQKKYCLRFIKNEIQVNTIYTIGNFLAFKTREIAEEFLNNNHELILKAKPFLG